MLGMNTLYLMSIRPQYARMIFAGIKKYELRKVSGAPVVIEGSTIIVYVSGRVKGIVGEFRAGKVFKSVPEKIWGLVYRPGTGIKEDAWAYIRGAKQAIAIEVKDAVMYERPVTLDEIRRILPGWMPPFSYKVIGEGDPLYELIIKPIRMRYGLE